MYGKDGIRRRSFIIGAGSAAAGAAVTGSAAARRSSGNGNNRRNDADRGLLIAHRGFADTYPENTRGAFELASQGGKTDRAAKRGADWIELDVFPTADGDIAVFHDEDLSDLTDTDGTIYETPSEEVFSAEVLESGETVPSLEDAYEVIPPNVGVNVDIKNGASDVQFGTVDSPEAEADDWTWLDDVVEIATSQPNDLLCSTFWEGGLWYLRDNYPEVPAAYLFAASIDEGIEVTDRYDTDAMNPPLSMIRDTPFFDEDRYGDDEKDVVEAAHERGIPVNVWTVNTWFEVEQLYDAGVDAIFADYPEIVNWGA